MKRCNFVAYIWKHAHFKDPLKNMQPTDNDYKEVNDIFLPIALVLMAAYELAAIFGLFMTSILHWFSSGSNWIFECFFPENLLKFWPAQFDKITDVSQKASLLIIQQNILCV